MTREERLEKQKLCDEFIEKLEQQITEFEQQTGIDFRIYSTYEINNLSLFKDSFKFTSKPFCYGPRMICQNGTTDHIYFNNNLDL